MRRAYFAALCSALAFAGSCAPPAETGIVSTWEPPRDAEGQRAAIAEGAQQLLTELGARGPEGLRALRLSSSEVQRWFTIVAAGRIASVVSGAQPYAAERRWVLWSSLGRGSVVGWCARGVRRVERDGLEGFRFRTLVVDRLLLVGREPGGLWGAWASHAARGPDGRWRLIPSVPLDEQVETPRRDHADMQLWDCDLGQRP